MSLLEVKCPHCKTSLWIDPATGSIVDFKTPDHKKLDLNDYIKSQKSRGTELEDIFKKAKEEQQKRKEQMEKDFKKAKENPDELTGDVQSPFQWE
ncbi:MAG: hypothetical protein JW795_19220 [Chitinivibrionales bacterium]|nr:hypothetical protein [Chitinivibrionales bacterium]